MSATLRRIAALVFGALTLAGCRLDVNVDTVVGADGSGEIVVVSTVDQEVVAAIDGLAGSIVLDDAVAAGWLVDGPSPTDEGGLTITLSHPFATVQEAANLLNGLGPPFAGIAMERAATDDEVTVTVTGTLTLPGGSWDAFGDQALTTSAGGTPFGQQLTDSGADPEGAMAVELSLRLPGEIEDASGDVGDGAVRWTAPLDGSVTELSARAVLRPGGGGGGWGDPVSTIALVLLVAWLAIGAVLAVLVARARSRRRNRPVRVRW